jgi:hypothetical protein
VTLAIGAVRVGIPARSMSIGELESVGFAHPLASNVELKLRPEPGSGVRVLPQAQAWFDRGAATRCTWKSKIETEQPLHARSY